MMTREQTCPVCLGPESIALETIDLCEQHTFYAPNDLETQRTLSEEAQKAAASYRMLRCRNCGLEYASPFVSPSARWYELSYPLLDAYPANRWDFEFVLASMRSTETLFEIGCGTGSFLKQCRSRGIAASGTDFSASAVARCIDSCLSASIMDVAAAGGRLSPGGIRYDVIASFHVLEHVADPHSFFTLATSLSADHAHLWIAVPSDRRPSRVFGERDFLDQPPHHMTRWSASALQKLAEPHPWRLADVVYEPLSLRSALWSNARHHPLYQRLITRSTGPRLERFVRYLLYPYLLCTLRHQERQSGLTMLAHYVKSC